MTLREDQLPPRELWLGKTDGEWPISVLHSESDVIYFLENGPIARTRRAWKVVSYELGPELIVLRQTPTLVEAKQERQ